MKKILLAIFCLTGILAKAQTINADLIELNLSGDSHPKHVTPANGKIYFSAEINSSQDRDLYVYNEVLGELQKLPVEIEGMNTYMEEGNFKMVGTTLFFTLAYGFNENILLKSDGTPEGTQVVKILYSDSWQNAAISNLTACGNQLFFTATSTENGNELWVSDGTEAGTHIVKDIVSGSQSSFPSNLFSFGGVLYFSALVPGIGNELWVTDGSEEGTTLFKDINPGNSGGFLGGLPIEFNNSFYFYANDGVNGNQVWKSDGTSQGTQVFTQMNNGIVNEPINGIAVSDDYFVFTFNSNGLYQLWTSDGTTENTVLLKTVNPSQDGFSWFNQFTVLDNTVYFVGEDWFSSKKLWKTNGTVTGTQQVVNLQDLSGGNIYQLTASESFLIFSATATGQYYNKPWVSDGTSAGTHLLNNLNISTAGEMNFTPIGNVVYFQADSNLNGVELWRTDGTEANTKILCDVSHRNSGLINPASAQTTAFVNGKMVVVGNDGFNGQEPFVTNGSQEGTFMLSNINTLEGAGSTGFNNEFNANIFTKAGNKLFFRARNNELGYELYVTDGTAEGTILLKDIAPGAADGVGSYTYFMEYNGIFYFKANEGIHGDELWRSDGTEAGTYLLKDIYPGSQSGITTSNSYTYVSKDYAVLNGYLYFVAKDNVGFAVWRTDGTEAGTVKAITVGSNGGVIILDATDSKLFLLSDYAPGDSLWSSDGTQEGTSVIGAYNVPNVVQFKKTCVLNNELYYVVWAQQGWSIYKTDGTVDGTVLVKPNLNMNGLQGMSFMMPCGDHVYFGFGDVFSSYQSAQLWQTDGTEEGTIVLGTSGPPHYGRFDGFTCYNDQFIYVQLFSGGNFWVTDGINTQNFLLNVNNGTQFDGYYGLHNILGVNNGKIYFEGITDDGGSEIYVANIEGVLGTDMFNTENRTVNNAIVYPNPARSIFTVSMLDNSVISTLSVYDLSGKKIFEKDVNDSENTIDAALWVTGIYIVKIKAGGATYTQKIIKN